MTEPTEGADPMGLRLRPNFVESPFAGGHYGICGICGDRTLKMGSERKALAAIADHRRDKHGEGS